jgi:Tubulin domain
VQLNQYELNSQIMPFEKWTVGEDLFADLDKEFDILDRDVRPFAEECDQMQGLQLIAGTDDAWGGFTARYLDSLRDEYGKTSIWVWGIEDGTEVPRHTRMIRSSNAARSLRALGQQASAYVRLTTMPSPVPSYVNIHSQSEWFTSALLCSAVESVSLPSRLHFGSARPTSLSLLEDTLNTNGVQKILELQMSLDDVNAQAATNGVSNGVNANEVDHEEPSGSSELNFSFLPSRQGRSNGDVHVFAQITSRRSRQERLTRTELDPDERMRMRLNEETIVDQYETSLLFPLLDTFPDSLFRTQRQGSGLALTTTLRTCSNLKPHVVQLRDEIVGSLDVEERESLYNDLTELANGYSFGWEEGSDSGEDS